LDGAKYFSKAISILISVSLQLSVKTTKQTYHVTVLKFAMRPQRLHRGYAG